MNNLALVLVTPLLAAVTSILSRKTRFKDQIAFTGALIYLSSVVLLAYEVMETGSVTLQAGGWAAPYGITLIADHLSVLMLSLTSLVALAIVLYSWGFISTKGKESGYYGFIFFMITGMSGAFITGDLFNLFVMFEIVLMSSYALVAYSGSKESLFISLKYVVLNLIGSSLMLVAIGGLYSITGTLNMAHMAQILSEGSVNMAPILGLASILFCVFAVKSALAPFHFWAPPVYANSPAPASAIMSGISKKVGIYAVIRMYLTVFSQAKIPQTAILFAGKSVTHAVGHLAIFMATITILLGGISALNREKLDKLLSYSSIGQVGFIFVPLSIAMIQGFQQALTASLVYIVAHGVAKPALFMISGVIKKLTGTTNLEDLGGLSESSFLLSSSFFILIFSLIGIPPLLGFFAKLLSFQAAFNFGKPFVLALLFIGSLTTLLYGSKAWLKIFFGETVEYDCSKVSKKELFSIIILVTTLLVVSLQFEPVYLLVEEASKSGLNTEKYIETVLQE